MEALVDHDHQAGRRVGGVLDPAHPAAHERAVVDDHVRQRDEQREQDRQGVVALGGHPDQPGQAGERVGQPVVAQGAARLAVAPEAPALVEGLPFGLEDEIPSDVRNQQHEVDLWPAHRAGTLPAARSRKMRLPARPRRDRA